MTLPNINWIVLSKYLAQIVAMLVAFNVIHITDAQLQLIIGFIGSVGVELGYQAHSTAVKTAEVSNSAAATVDKPPVPVQ